MDFIHHAWAVELFGIEADARFMDGKGGSHFFELPLETKFSPTEGRCRTKIGVDEQDLVSMGMLLEVGRKIARHATGNEAADFVVVLMYVSVVEFRAGQEESPASELSCPMDVLAIPCERSAFEGKDN